MVGGGCLWLQLVDVSVSRWLVKVFDIIVFNLMLDCRLI